ncbi:C1QT3-like protein [Mya arenaria]|uniref:C1QT3-like protein n=1 Tax=Mya arenaria TaxID=6604 RepID=A0ABY7EB69_MYAAR|nr:complement C1q-like protein 4 [Mya arenaria]WAR04406.1 C1QT3-like protein [Mya arenaria]
MKALLLILLFLIYAISMTYGKGDGEQRRDKTRHSGRRQVSEVGDDITSGHCELEITCKGDTTSRTPVRLPIRGPRGPAGRPGEKGPSGEPGIPGKQGVPGKSATANNQVAFFVGLGENLGPIDANTDLIMDKVVTNVGDAYEPMTGKFTAPFSGTYHFTVVVAAQGRQKAAVMLMEDGKMTLTVWAESVPYWATSSNTALLTLHRDQQVWLVRLQRAPYLHGYMYSSFSGYMLFSENPDVRNRTENELPVLNEMVETTEINTKKNTKQKSNILPEVEVDD